MGAVIDQIKRLTGNGYTEVVLSGVDLTSYGADLPGAPRLGKLVKTILLQVPGLARLRLSSIDSIEADDDLMEALANEARLMPHLHLSLQAGDDMILERMKRRHLRDDSIRFCEDVRRLRPEIVFGADIIAGFPTETETMFENSLRIVEECGLTHLHVFPFSPRKGTPASRMPQLDRTTIKERAARLRATGEAAYRRHLESLAGTSQSLLIEREGIGRTEGFALATLASGAPGEIVQARIVGHDGEKLIAAPLPKTRAA
jgi:threonylcarbamoyladenosine tRNA methylthiotransferase MtaB